MNPPTIPNSLVCAIFKYIKAIMNTPPSVGGVATQTSIKHITIGKVFCLENASNKRARISENSPSLLSKKSKIESLKISES